MRMTRWLTSTSLTPLGIATKLGVSPSSKSKFRASDPAKHQRTFEETLEYRSSLAGMLEKSPQRNVSRWFIVSVASVINSFLAEDGWSRCWSRRRSQPFCFRMSEILPSVAHALPSHHYSLSEVIDTRVGVSSKFGLFSADTNAVS